MTTPTIAEIIARLVRAQRGSRELDWLVADVLSLVPAHTIKPVGWDYNWYRNSETEWALWKANDSEGRNTSLWQPKQCTTSLDAALTLVPDGWSWKLIWEPAEGFWRVVIRRAQKLEDVGIAFVTHGKTAAMAMTEAALRARQEKE